MEKIRKQLGVLMPDHDRISGWIFVSSDSTQVIFVPIFSAPAHLSLPWKSLSKETLFNEFHQHFKLKGPVRVQQFRRYKISADLKEVQDWLTEKQNEDTKQ